MEEADRLCNRVAIMDHGKILALDTPDGLKTGRRGGHDRDGEGARATGSSLAEVLERDVEGVTRVRQTEDALELHVRGGQRLLARVVAVAESAGFEVADLSVAEPSLETVFISLTGRELRD